MARHSAHIVLVGGGHANVLALLRLAHQCRLTLVSDATDTPYSGMLPGYIAGHYQPADCFINLRRLSEKCGAELIIDRAVGLVDNQLQLAYRAPLRFDVLSLNPGAVQVPPVSIDDSCTVKPIEPFIRWLSDIDIDRIGIVTVVGGGAGGLETVLALSQRWQQRITLRLITRHFLRGFPDGMRRRVRAILSGRDIMIEEATVVDYTSGQLILLNGESRTTDKVIFATAVSAPVWFRQIGLSTDSDGFIRVNAFLQSVDAERIFVSGDAASHPLATAKSGVMAVRQGATLANNLLVAAGCRRDSLRHWPSSQRALYIIGTGDQHAIASWNSYTAAGRWVWWWKQYLDIRFMRRFEAIA